MYNPAYLSSEGFMEVENMLFSNGFYQAQETSPNKPGMTPCVELLIAERDEELSAEEVKRQTAVLNKQDVRHKVVRHLYRAGVHQQYALRSEERREGKESVSTWRYRW